MRIVIFGTSSLAVPCLSDINNTAHEIKAVVTSPDRPKGRHLKKAFSPVKETAMRHKMEILQPSSPNDKDFINILRSKDADVFIVISYGYLLKKEILSVPKIMPLNLHFSLLPKYRGAAPINWAIINGEKFTGVSIIHMDEGLDSGPVLTQKPIKILDNDNSVTLGKTLAVVGSKLLMETLESINKREIKPVIQNESEVTLAPKLKKADGIINWNKRAYDITNFIRGIQSWPGAFTRIGEQTLKVWEARCYDSGKSSDYRPGQIVDIIKNSGIIVKTIDRHVLLTVVQLESHKKMNAYQFAIGKRIKKGMQLEIANPKL